MAYDDAWLSIALLLLIIPASLVWMLFVVPAQWHMKRVLRRAAFGAS
jgi:hypothetical protein